jgi:thiol:disulfide interchange protein DsbA
MFKRFTRLQLFALVSGMLLASACSAQPGNAAPYTDGTEYVTLPGPHQRYSDTGKVEVAEVFSYGCIHCAEFAEDAAKLRKQLPAGAQFKLVPAVFNAEWVPFARAFYAAKQLGVVERTHQQLFHAKFDEHFPINSIGELADFYAREGVNKSDFMRIAGSEGATASLKHNFDLIQKWGVDGTPTLVVDGKYRVMTVGSHAQMLAVTLWLVKRELAGK